MKFDIAIIENSFEEMSQEEPFVCSFSGGKDSAIALSMACEKGKIKGLLHWSDSKTSLFHSQNLAIIKYQATHMGLSLLNINYTPWKHRMELLKTYKKLAEQGIKSVIFGDIYMVESVKMQSILCNMAGLVPRYPLWNKKYNELFEEIEKRKIKTIITRVNTAMMSDEWLGHVFDKKVYTAFCQLGIDPFGENGEYHTTVVDADTFIYPIDFGFSEIQENDKIILQLTSHHCIDNIYHIIN